MNLTLELTPIDENGYAGSFREEDNASIILCEHGALLFTVEPDGPNYQGVSGSFEGDLEEAVDGFILGEGDYEESASLYRAQIAIFKSCLDKLEAALVKTVMKAA